MTTYRVSGGFQSGSAIGTFCHVPSAYSVSEDTLESDIKRLRLVMLVGAVLIALFMVADLKLLPAELHDVYLADRLFLQIPIVLALLVYSFHRRFSRDYQVVLLAAILALTYANYFLIYLCWRLGEFSFPYEGTVLYAFFGFFVMGMSFRCAVIHCLLASAGFALLVFAYPIYGIRTNVSLGFVIASLFIGVFGLYRLNMLFGKIHDANAQLRQMSTTDALSNLLNRRAMIEESEQLLNLSRRSGTPMAVFMVDIDFFKEFNDAYGHQEGDRAIVTQADILRQVFRRQTDVLGRYGGEEFLVTTMDISEADCDWQAEQIIQHWRHRAIPNVGGDGGEILSCSVGVCHGRPSGSTTLEDMIRCADEALYEAKHNGRARFVRKSPALSGDVHASA